MCLLWFFFWSWDGNCIILTAKESSEIVIEKKCLYIMHNKRRINRIRNYNISEHVCVALVSHLLKKSQENILAMYYNYKESVLHTCLFTQFSCLNPHQNRFGFTKVDLQINQSKNRYRKFCGKWKQPARYITIIHQVMIYLLTWC